MSLRINNIRVAGCGGIIDNLNTDDSNRALSAKQGKILNNAKQNIIWTGTQLEYDALSVEEKQNLCLITEYNKQLLVEEISLDEEKNLLSSSAILKALSKKEENCEFIEICNYTLSEAQNTVLIEDDKLIGIEDLYMYIMIPKRSIEGKTNIDPGALGIRFDNATATGYQAYISIWNHLDYDLYGTIFSKLYEDRRINLFTNLAANASMNTPVLTTISNKSSTLHDIKISCITASSTLPAGTNIIIKGYRRIKDD